MIQNILDRNKITGLYSANSNIHQNRFLDNLERRMKLTKEMAQNIFQPRAQYLRALRKIYKTPKENMKSVIDMLRKQVFPNGNYIIGDLFSYKIK